ncbi:MAG TPA: hypothetical protein VNE16_14900 [Vicinamibacterales bacterium]|nr:hypothetical protein [Vicinamibacterales bacterium]
MDIPKDRNGKVGRRGFLRGSGLAAAALGAGLLTSSSRSQAGAATPGAPKDAPPADANLTTYKDAQGRAYRICPMCGGTMYRQGRVWTCSNCGYSYTE